MDNNAQEIKSAYTDVFAMTYSPCGNFLVAGDIYGRIFVYDLRLILNPEHEITDKKRKAQLMFKADENGQVNCFVSTDKFLIIGCSKTITAYEWKQIQHLKQPKVAWNLPIPASRDNLSCNEVNGLVIDQRGRLVAGCGDGKIYVFSLEDGKLIQTINGHTNSIRALTISEKKQIISGGEDGIINFWDPQTNKPCAVIEPSKEVQLSRSIGKWVGVVGVEKDWLSAAGGFKPCLYHLGSMQLASSFEIEPKGTYVCKLHEERVLIGDGGNLAQFTMQGEKISSISSSASTVYCMALQETPHHVLAFAGTAPDIDICTNFNYKDQTLVCAVE